MNHKVSIIIPAYNSESSIERAIKSCLQQTYQDIEIIVINDGSSDQTESIIEQYVNVVKIITQSNQGVGVARNSGIKLATGQYVYFLDADDSLDAFAIDKMVKSITPENTDVVISGYKIVTDKQKIAAVPKLIERLNAIDNFMLDKVISSPWAKLFKTEIIKANNVEFSEHKIMQDSIFNIRYFCQVNKIAVIETPLYIYDKSLSTSTKIIDESKLKEIYSSLDKQIEIYIDYLQSNKITVDTDIIDARILRLGILFPLNSKSNCSVLKNKLKEYSLSRVFQNKHLGIHEKVLLLSYRIGLYPFIFTSAVMNSIKKSVTVFKRNFN